jgi:hypothetical protein
MWIEKTVRFGILRLPEPFHKLKKTRLKFPVFHVEHNCRICDLEAVMAW